MKITLTSQKPIDTNSFIRRCGYAIKFDRRSNKQSFTKRLSNNYYPRFHLYIISKSENQTILDLHLDQKKIIIGKKIEHAGEYDGKLITDEAGRIKEQFLNVYQ